MLSYAFKKIFSFDEVFCEPFRPKGRGQASVVSIQEEEESGQEAGGRNKSRSDAEPECNGDSRKQTADGNSDS